MKLLTAEQMRLLDETAIKSVGIPGVVLMENASHDLYDVIDNEFHPLRGKKVAIVCGKGNNGGDGFAVARHLLLAGAEPMVFLAARRKDVSGDAKTNLDICRNLKISIEEVHNAKHLAAMSKALKSAVVVVDALLGTGVKGPVKPAYLSIINAINKCGKPVVSVDVPSGISVNDGRVFNGAVHANFTVTFGAPKIGLFIQPAASRSGLVCISDIGIPPALLEKVRNEATLFTGELAAGALGVRAETSHKGDCGKVLVVGGSKGMSGSIILAGSAALKTGAGLVYMTFPESLSNIVGKKFTEAVSLPMPEEDGRFAARAAYEILDKMRDVDAVVLGPGLGVSSHTVSLVSKVITTSRVPVLVDADALNCVAKNISILKKAKAPITLTPHPGEMARMTGSTLKAIQESRLDSARSFAKEHGVVLLLKGSDTITASPDGHVFINSTGNPGMATAGSGDVLSGIAGALLAEGMEPVRAAACAAFIHGAAGDKAAEKRGTRSMTASDIINGISETLKSIETERETA